MGWLVIINNLSNQLILSFTPKKHRWWPLLIVLFKIGGTSTTVTGVEIEFWNKNNNRIHLMFERIEKHVHWASISMTSEMWSAIMIICCWATETIENSSPRQCNTWGLQTHHHSWKTRRCRKHGRAIFFKLAVLILYLCTCNFLFCANHLMQWKSKHPASLQRYETLTGMVFHAIMVQIMKRHKMSALVLLQMLNVMSVLFFYVFKLCQPQIPFSNFVCQFIALKIRRSEKTY